MKYLITIQTLGTPLSLWSVQCMLLKVESANSSGILDENSLANEVQYAQLDLTGQRVLSESGKAVSRAQVP